MLFLAENTPKPVWRPGCAWTVMGSLQHCSSPPLSCIKGLRRREEEERKRRWGGKRGGNGKGWRNGREIKGKLTVMEISYFRSCWHVDWFRDSTEEMGVDFFFVYEPYAVVINSDMSCIVMTMIMTLMYSCEKRTAWRRHTDEKSKTGPARTVRGRRQATDR